VALPFDWLENGKGDAPVRKFRSRSPSSPGGWNTDERREDGLPPSARRTVEGWVLVGYHRWLRICPLAFFAGVGFQLNGYWKEIESRPKSVRRKRRSRKAVAVRSTIVSRADGWVQKVVGKEEAGGLIGEMAVLDPAPRSATVVAGADGTRVLRLNGDAFRHSLNLEPAIADGVIRALAQRLRGSTVSP